MNPTNEIYSLRNSFCIIGLTGKMGSGCSSVSDLLCSPNEEFLKDKEVRNPLKIAFIKDDKGNMNSSINLFKRKYSICYNFIEKNRIRYEVIDYKKALILYTLIYTSSKKDNLNSFYNLINKLFAKAGVDKESALENVKLDVKKLRIETEVLLKKLFNDFKKIDKNFLELKLEDQLILLASIFFENDSHFNKFYSILIKQLGETNYYFRTFLFHKLANNIRATGSPFEDSDNSNSHIYAIAKFINRLIKAYKVVNKNCHLVIDSLKNSLEIMFFKERYSAFYLMAVHHENGYKERIKNKIQKKNKNQDLILRKLIELDNDEYCSNDFKNGDFSGPDVQNCIQKAEIHILNSEFTKEPTYEFYTIREQLIKIQSLIMQPGIITPSNIERCMQIAYNSKFNSGCISRQVGAVITDSSFSIKSVGWNDVPKNTISCLFRSVNEILDNVKIQKEDKSYSRFELKKSEYKYKPNKVGVPNKEYIDNNFSENLSKKYTGKLSQLESDGKNCPFCFKSLHNDFEGFENQVHTRSLHAEENAMLQISKYGGQPLEHGVLFTTASPCELCSKKAYQLGIKTVYYIDPYPGISMEHVLNHGYGEPNLKLFNGIIGRSFNKLYEPFMSYKDEISIYMKKL